MKFLVAVVGSLFAALTASAAFDLGLFFADDSAWTTKAEIFVAEHAKEGFRFASEERNIANSLRPDTCVCWGLPVWETKVYFEKPGEIGGVSRVEISLYNRGDAKTPLFMADLEEKLAVLSKHLASGGRDDGSTEKTALRSGGTRYRRLYANGERPAEVSWGVSEAAGKKESVVEHLRLVLFPKGMSVAKPRGAKRPVGAAGWAKIKENVVRNSAGDVFVDNVPMVDQGQKGYCAAAVSERVLRYYGNLVDEHEIAQQAGTTAEGGTSVSAMKKVVASVGARNGLGFQEIVSMMAGVGDIRKDLARYNRAAKLEKAEELALADFTHNHVIQMDELRSAMNPKVVYRMRMKDSRFKKFSAGVRQQVNAGIPVFWGVTLGLFPETKLNPQTQGGHMRLIIGYNDKSKEILYTDTWGAGHELKRMPEATAFAITHDAFFLKPR